jgi:hypothetical protein
MKLRTDLPLRSFVRLVLRAQRSDREMPSNAVGRNRLK